MSGHFAVQSLCPLCPEAAISRENFLSAYSHPFAGASLFRSEHNHIHIERACIEQAASAVQHCRGIPFLLVPSLRRRRASRVKFGRSATIRVGVRFEILLAIGQYLLVSCAWPCQLRTNTIELIPARASRMPSRKFGIVVSFVRRLRERELKAELLAFLQRSPRYDERPLRPLACFHFGSVRAQTGG